MSLRTEGFSVWTGNAALIVVAAVPLAALAALAGYALAAPGDVGRLFDAYLVRVVVFTVWQASLSVLASIVPAIVLAHVLARRNRLFLRTLLVRLLALPFVLPALVVALATLAVWGRSGWVNSALGLIGVDASFDIYGLPGILLAHVFFNFSLAGRMLLNAIETIPPETWRLAAQLGLTRIDTFRLIEWPAMRQVLPTLAGLIFLLAVTSFTIVLTLGGGPAATTLEVAVYQALRFDFQPARAVILALVQIAICALFATAARRHVSHFRTTAPVRRGRPPLGREAPLTIVFDYTVIIAASLFVLAPVLAIVAAGANASWPALVADAGVWRAVATSLAVAAAAATLCTALSIAIIAATRARRHRNARPATFAAMAQAAASLVLVIPPIVMAAGWFILLRPVSDVFALAPILVVVINALMALPFSLAILSAAATRADAANDRLARSLAITGWNRLRLVDLPALAGPAGLALAIAMALSLGDLGVIALVGSHDFTTLPLLIYQRMGAYRMDEAAGLSLLLTGACLVLIAAAEAAVRTAETRAT